MNRTCLVLLIFVLSVKTYACSCECNGNCTFKRISNEANFVALIKVIELSDFVVIDEFHKEPRSMIVKVIKKYKGKENRKTIKIWRGNGADCRPYASSFKKGEYYLIAPEEIGVDYRNEKLDDYHFFSCVVGYLKVDYDNGVVLGKYSKWRNKISLDKFERKLK